MTPAPLVPAHIDLRDFAFMPLDVERLRDSDLAASTSAEEFRCAVLLWCAAWHQIPAGSLPDDDVILANLAGFGRSIREWRKHKAGALRKWTACNDGRLYHPVICEKAAEAWNSKQRQRDRTSAARNARLSRQHKSTTTDDVALSVTDPDTEPVTSSKGQGQGQGKSPSLRSGDAREGLIEFKTSIVRAYGAANVPGIPDTARAAVWLAQGRDPALCLAVIADVLGRRKGKSLVPLSYFDRPIEDAHAGNGPLPKPNGVHQNSPAPPTRSTWEMRFSDMRAGQGWQASWGPRFGRPDCQAPPDLVEQHVAWCRARNIEVAT